MTEEFDLRVGVQLAERGLQICHAIAQIGTQTKETFSHLAIVTNLRSQKPATHHPTGKIDSLHGSIGEKMKRGVTFKPDREVK